MQCLSLMGQARGGTMTDQPRRKDLSARRYGADEIRLCDRRKPGEDRTGDAASRAAGRRRSALSGVRDDRLCDRFRLAPTSRRHRNAAGGRRFCEMLSHQSARRLGRVSRPASAKTLSWSCSIARADRSTVTPMPVGRIGSAQLRRPAMPSHCSKSTASAPPR